MMSKPANPISTLQFILFITALQSSVVFLLLPRYLVSVAGTDGWLAIPFGWLFSSIAAIVIVRIMSYHPDGTVLDLLESNCGKWASRAAAVLFAVYFFLFAYDGIMITILVTKVWLLPDTSVFILALLFLLSSVSIAQHGLQIISRYVVIVALMSLWIPIIYLVTLQDAEWLYLLPLLKEGWSPVISAVKIMVYPSLGLVAAFFLYPHLNRKKYAVAAIVAANTLSHLLYLFITIICFVFFSPQEIYQLNNPVIFIMKSLEFKFIERVEVPFIAFYLLIFSLDSIPAMFIVSYCLKQLGNRRSIRFHLGLVIAAILLVILVHSPSIVHVDDINYALAVFGFVVEYVLPFCLLLYLKMRRRRTQT